jgi:hypothetical protein
LAKHVKLYQEEGKPKTQINSNFDISSVDGCNDAAAELEAIAYKLRTRAKVGQETGFFPPIFPFDSEDDLRSAPVSDNGAPGPSTRPVCACPSRRDRSKSPVHNRRRIRDRNYNGNEEFSLSASPIPDLPIREKLRSAKNASPVKNASVAVVIRDRRPPSAREQAGPSSQSGRVIFLSWTTRLIN